MLDLSKKLSINIILIYKIFEQLSHSLKRKLFLLLLVNLISGSCEALTLASTIPFFTLLSDPEILWKIKFIKNLSLIFGINSTNDLFLPITIGFIFMVMFTSGIRLFNLRLNLYIAAKVGSYISYKCFKKLLNQNYEFYLLNNTSRIITDSIIHINTTVLMIEFTLQLITSVIIAIFLIISLHLVNWKVAIISCIIFSTSYIYIAYFAKTKLIKNSFEIASKNQKITQILQESIGSIRDVIINQTQGNFLKNYKLNDINLRNRNAESQFLGTFPRFALEGIGIILLLLISLTIYINTNRTDIILPIVGSLAIGIQRLLPVMQMIYNNWATIKGNTKAISNVVEMLERKNINHSGSNILPLKIKSHLSLNNVSFKYKEGSEYIFRGLNLKINKGEKIGIIGLTGSGKSTLMDILMGLLKPTSGEFIVDNEKIYKSKKLLNWRKSLSHVPQNVYLLDISFKENIALGIEEKDINFEKVIDCSKKARIHDYIISQPKNYNEIVGERGSKLSGGQIQRIGIARSLYNDPEVLFLDEATSSLDIETEKEVIEELENLSDNLTIISIAHKKSALKNCDKIFKLEKGKLINIKY